MCDKNTPKVGTIRKYLGYDGVTYKKRPDPGSATRNDFNYHGPLCS